jgi:putative Ca2+/H+ antiporter (TMEM165/GDT1 family)
VFDIAVAATVFGLIFVAELPDKTAVATLLLATKYPARWVFSGIAAAFAVHVVIAVAAGSLIALLPRRPVEAVVGVLFLVGAVLLWREASGDDEEEEASDDVPEDAGFWKIAGVGFGVILVAEFGDLTQILTANLAAKYSDPLSVGVGALLGLWAVALVAIYGGKTLLRVLPITWIVRVAAAVMLALAGYSLVTAITG